MRVAIIHDWLNQYGGAERVLEVLRSLFPAAPVYTSMFWPAALPAVYRTWDIRRSFLDRWPLVKRRHLWFLPFYPLAFESFDLSGYDLVISNKSAFCHGIITGPETVHICYCLTPTRFLWQSHDYVAREEVGGPARIALPLVLSHLRLWDRLAADRVDAFVAISRAVRERIHKFYRRDSEVIHPPIDFSQFQPCAKPDDYFLIVSRLIPYKRIDLAVQAFSQLDRPLVIIGDGRDRRKLEAIAGPNVRFLGSLPDNETRRAMARCQALIFPGLEDFGLVPVEAQAAGRPVIAYAGGGALDTVIEGVTGTFFHQPVPDALAGAVAHFDPEAYDPAKIRRHASQFDVAVFKERLSEFTDRALSQTFGDER
jgi:glycosyltransferase involved in cell wall biosynthesis